MRVAIHQPNYLPWIGYFNKMNQADIFVILDNVQFSKDSYTQRTKIRTKEGSMWLTIPISKRDYFNDINGVSLYQKEWCNKHYLSILANYSRSKHCDLDFLNDYYLHNNYSILKDFNMAGINYLKNRLRISTKIVMASELDIDNNLKSTNLLIEIVKKLEGKTYVSGTGGVNYQDENLFHNNDIEIEYVNVNVVPHLQRWGGFISGLSTIDLLFNLGSDDSIVYLNDLNKGVDNATLH